MRWLAGTAALAALAVAAPSPAGALRLLGQPSAADPFAPVVAAVALVAWALAGWLLVAAVVTAAGRLPGAAGSAARAIAAHIAPRAVRRVLETALGLTVAAGSLGAAPASAADARPHLVRPAAAPALDWPTPAAPALDWPAPSSAPHAPTAPPTTPPTAAPAAVVVRPGDTLWAIAAEHLGPAAPPVAVARSWPRWWSANRAAIGDDPDLIRPGTRLVPPPDPSTR